MKTKIYKRSTILCKPRKEPYTPTYFTDAWFECPHCGLTQPRDIPGFVQECDQCGKVV